MNKLAYVGVAALMLAASAAVAEQEMTVGIGATEATSDAEAALVNLEYRGEYLWRQLRPQVGAWAANDGSAYAYGGFMYDVTLDDAGTVFLIPSTAVGLYHSGAGKDMGGAVEFRSGVELAYKMDHGAKLGLAIHHLSNAGIYDRNPGQETVTVSYTLPLQWLASEE